MCVHYKDTSVFTRTNYAQSGHKSDAQELMGKTQTLVRQIIFDVTRVSVKVAKRRIPNKHTTTISRTTGNQDWLLNQNDLVET